jgi:DNA-binding NtrC family response regulator
MLRPQDDSLKRLLGFLIEASGYERVFLVGDALDAGGKATYRLHASCSRRGDGRTRPSRAVLRRALTGSQSRPSSLTIGAELPEAASVRSLDLRSVIAAPVPCVAPARLALVLDSRESRASGAVPLGELLGTFAALVSLLLPTHALSTRSEAGSYPEPERNLCARSDAFRRMVDWVRRIAPSDLSVLIQGESGTGKERVCREIHNSSRRRDGPLVAVNCGALPETLLEAELFGSVRGAYTGSDRDRPGLFRLAHAGTLFLDEVGDMSLAMQAKLLRVLQESKVRPLGGSSEIRFDVRVVAASHRDLLSQIEERSFRSDLYFRLAVLRVDVPPLRERLDDLPDLVRDLAPRLLRETGFGPPRLSAAAWEVLLRHRWPGNVRELHSVLARALIRAGDAAIEPRHLSSLQRDAERGPGRQARQLERQMILLALSRSGGQIASAARSIGWSRQKLYRRIKALGIARPAFPLPATDRRAAAQSRERGTTSSDSSTFQ